MHNLLDGRSKMSSVTLDEQETLLENIWAAFERANEQCPAHNKIAKHSVLVTSLENPCYAQAREQHSE